MLEKIKSTEVQISKLPSELHSHDIPQGVLEKLGDAEAISKFSRVVDSTIKQFTDSQQLSESQLTSHINETTNARNIRLCKIIIPTLEKFSELTDIKAIRDQWNKVEQEVTQKRKDTKHNKQSEYIEGRCTALNALGEQLDNMSALLTSMRDQSYVITRRDYTRANPEHIIKPDIVEGAHKRLEDRLDNEQFILEDAAGTDQETENRLKKRVKTCQDAIAIVAEFQQSIQQGKKKKAWEEIQLKAERSESHALAANALQEQEIELLANQCQKSYEDCLEKLPNRLTKDQQIQEKFKAILKKRYQLTMAYKGEFDQSLKSLNRIRESESDFREAAQAFHRMADHPQLYDFIKWAPTDYTQVNTQNITNPNLVAEAVKFVALELGNEQFVRDDAKGLGPDYEDKLVQRVEICKGAKEIIEDFQRSILNGEGEEKWNEIKQKSRKIQKYNKMHQKEQEAYEETDEARKYTFAANILKNMEIKLLAEQCQQYRDESLDKLAQISTEQELVTKALQDRCQQALLYKEQYLAHQDTESERKFRVIAKELHLLAKNPEQYIEQQFSKWFNEGKAYATSLLAGSKPKDLSLRDLSMEERHLLAENPEVYREWFEVEKDAVTALLTESHSKNAPEDTFDSLNQAVFNDGAHSILKDQLQLKELEQVNRKYHALCEKFSKLSEKLDEGKKTELEELTTMLHGTEEASQSHSELFDGIFRVVEDFNYKNIVIEHWRKEDEYYEKEKEYTPEEYKLSALKKMLEEYESNVSITKLFQDIHRILKDGKGKNIITENWNAIDEDSKGNKYAYTYRESKMSMLERMMGEYKAKVSELEKRIAKFSKETEPMLLQTSQQDIPHIKLDLVEPNKLTESNKKLLDQQEAEGPDMNPWLKFVTEARKDEIGKQMRKLRNLLDSKHLPDDEIRKRLPKNIEQLKELWSALASQSGIKDETRNALNKDIRRLDELLTACTKDPGADLEVIKEESLDADNDQEKNDKVEEKHPVERDQSQTITPPSKAYIPDNK